MGHEEKLQACGVTQPRFEGVVFCDGDCWTQEGNEIQWASVCEKKKDDQINNNDYEVGVTCVSVLKIWYMSPGSRNACGDTNAAEISAARAITLVAYLLAEPCYRQVRFADRCNSAQ
jgi:hypothetical protein